MALRSPIGSKIQMNVPIPHKIKFQLRHKLFILLKINRQKLGLKLLAFIFVNIDRTDNIQHFRETIIQQRCVLECHHVAGSHDYLLKVVLEDTSALEDFLSKTLKNIKGVVNSNTIISLTTLKEELQV